MKNFKLPAEHQKINFFLSFLCVCTSFVMLNKMWIHPDSMVSGGLRFLSQGPTNFDFGTYGTIGFLIWGLLCGVLFIIGLILNKWNSFSSFEYAYRKNDLGFNMMSFTQFSIIANLIIVFFSMVLIYKTLQRLSFSDKNFYLIPIIFTSIPITFSQMSLDTIEPLVFFGMCLLIYLVSVLIEINFQTNLKLKIIIFFTLIFTVGVRINLLVILIPIFLYIYIKLNTNQAQWLRRQLLISLSLTLVTYIPILMNFDGFLRTVKLIRGLSKLSFNSKNFANNLETYFLNFGIFFGSLTILVASFYFGLFINSVRNDFKRTSPKFQEVLSIVFVVHFIFFLFNINGFPKYLVPIMPVTIFFLIILSLKFINFVSKNFGNFSFIASFLIFLIFSLVGINNFVSYQKHSIYDTRSSLSSILPSSKKWLDKLSANITVITELTRGNPGIPYSEIVGRAKVLNQNQIICNDFMIISSRESTEEFSRKINNTCFRSKDLLLISLSPYVEEQKWDLIYDWGGLLSEGTKSDEFRIAFGPSYRLFLIRTSPFLLEVLQNCRTISPCKILRE